MMTNQIAALYPDIFNAGASWSGVPAKCFNGASSSNPMSPDQSCAQGQKPWTKKEWGDLARGMYPGYTGKRTRMMICHGTADTLVVWKLYQQQLDQWSDVLGVEKTKETQNKPIQNWTEASYGDGTKLVGYGVQGGGHIPPFQDELVLKFFGLL
jgi:acetylxylan esterase